MNQTEKHAKNIERFRQGVFAHDRENPDHTAYGIGLSAHDMDRLGYDEGETLWGSIKVETDGGVSGNFRVLCDGDHDSDKADVEEKEMVVTGGGYARRTIEAGSWKDVEECVPRWRGH